VPIALETVVPVGLGLVVFYTLMRARNGAGQARVATARFALVWVPAATAIVLAATLF
jgi:hypothetical protein